MGHDATSWLKWTAGNDVRGRASGVGRRGWKCRLGGSVCVASLVPWNSKAVGSAPDQTAIFPEKSLIHLLAVVVGVGVGVVGPCWLYVRMFYVDSYECVATIV